MTLKAGRSPLRLPDAYHSSATHFSPIILSNQDKKAAHAKLSLGKDNSRTDKAIKELKRQLLKSHGAQDIDIRISSVDAPTGPADALPVTVAATEPSNSIPRLTSKPQNSSNPSSSKPLPSAKPSMIHSREKGADSTPVTQAVRPLPRPSDTQTDNGSPSVHSRTTTSSAVMANRNAVQQTSIQTTIPSISPAHGSQPLIVSSATLPPTIIPSYPTVPMVLQGDSTASGAVSWIPVVANAAHYNIAPYWTMQAQQTPVISTVQQTPGVSAPSVLEASSERSLSHTQNSNVSQLTQPDAPKDNQSIITQQGQQGQQGRKMTSKSKNRAPAAPRKHRDSDSNSDDTTPKKPVPRSRKINQSQCQCGSKSVFQMSRLLPFLISLPGAQNPLENCTPTVTNLRQLLRNEFAFEGYMDQGEEDLEMGEPRLFDFPSPMSLT